MNLRCRKKVGNGERKPLHHNAEVGWEVCRGHTLELVPQTLDIGAIFRRGHQQHKRNQKKKLLDQVNVNRAWRRLKVLWALAHKQEDQHAAVLSWRSSRNSRNAECYKAKWTLKEGSTEKEEEREGMKREIMWFQTSKQCSLCSCILAMPSTEKAEHVLNFKEKIQAHYHLKLLYVLTMF